MQTTLDEILDQTSDYLIPKYSQPGNPRITSLYSRKPISKYTCTENKQKESYSEVIDRFHCGYEPNVSSRTERGRWPKHVLLL